MISSNSKENPVRFAVVGLGHFAQTAVLPAFANANTCKLSALISSDGKKLETLKRKYKVEHTLGYEKYDEFLHSGLVDAVYIVLPNDMHCDYTLRAAAAGIHVLCEKPMAVTGEEGERMISACESAKVKLMVAYRLHFEPSNLAAIEILKKGTLGQLRYFNSSFSLQVNDDNIRVKAVRGGGPLLDIGVYCINAARYLFQSDPLEVTALQSYKPNDSRFQEVEEQMGVTMRFPEDRLASFVCSFNSMENNFYEVVGTEGRLLVTPAYSHSEPMYHQLSLRGKKTKENKFKKHDQIAAEIIYFANCILNNEVPEPSGNEGLADLRVIEAIQKSAQESGKAVPIQNIPITRKPTILQKIIKPAHDQPPVVHAESPHR